MTAEMKTNLANESVAVSPMHAGRIVAENYRTRLLPKVHVHITWTTAYWGGLNGRGYLRTQDLSQESWAFGGKGARFEHLSGAGPVESCSLHGSSGMKDRVHSDQRFDTWPSCIV